MRPHLPLAIAAAIERCTRPTLVFELAKIEATMKRVAGAARAAGIRPLFAAKSFPRPEVRALAAELLDGFDVASPGEVNDVTGGNGRASRSPTGEILSVADPSGAAIAAAKGWRGRLIVGCETPEQVAAAPAHAEIAIRISASLAARDPAMGAVLEGSGRRRSRFGLDVEPARRRELLGHLVAAAAGRPVGLHVHHGPVTATSAERFVATARAVLADAGLEPAFLDLGGAWHGIDDLAGAFATVRAAVPSSIELLVEPGRLYAHGAGFATGRVRAARLLDDRELRVLDLSRACHLRWSQPELVAYPPHAGDGRVVLFVGPTCYEEDVLGEWTVDPQHFPPDVLVVLRDITGYAVGWNTGFGGVPPADVIMA